MADNDHDETCKDLGEAVNMTLAGLEKRLKTGESRDVGTGAVHDEGEKVVAIRHEKKADMTAEDYRHMAKVVGYVRR